jgi:hypothetical protein
VKDPQKLKELIVEKLSLADIMIKYGVQFAYNPHLTSEVQFKCPIHGKDTKPSARLYNNTKTCYCWVCRKAWDVVSFTKEMEKFSFGETLNYLINVYKIDTSSIPDAPTLDLAINPPCPEESVLIRQIRSNILSFRKKIPLEKYRALCWAFIITNYSKSRGMDIIESLNKLQEKISCLKKP